jgi:group I intron endonuclease
MNKGIIYKIENLVNGKLYIGQTCAPLYKRRSWHFRSLERKKHTNIHLQRSYDKHGRDKFVLKIIEQGIPTEDLDKKEIEYIQKFNSTDQSFGYNILGGGASVHNHAPESIAKMTDSHNRRVASGWVSPLKGRKQRPEVVAARVQRQMEFLYSLENDPRIKPVVSSDGRKWRSIEEAAQGIGSDRSYVSRRIKQGKLCKGLHLRIDYAAYSGSV